MTESLLQLRANKTRIPTHRRCAVESLGGHAILNCVQERAARGGWHLLNVRQKNMITLVHVLSPAVTLLFLVAAIIHWRKARCVASIVLLVSGLLVFISDVIIQYSLAWPSYSGELDSSPSAIMDIVPWVHVCGFVSYASTLIWILSSSPRQSGQ